MYYWIPPFNCYIVGPAWTPYMYRPQYPPVNPDYLYESANYMQPLIQDINRVLDKLGSSKEFDEKLMEAAQVNDKEEVKRLIDTLDINADVKIDYTPDSLSLTFEPMEEERKGCCKVETRLRWR
ncbi:hypothetical protein [Oceanobacillus halotolerans]|uniref:hypothetical protein n=1 Tax=Oceanobacillus halotolerans TaxID=2663380 RepID=UPI0013D9DCBA|nr:hypothetical protein [Oceanobacillus halotolerans]